MGRIRSVEISGRRVSVTLEDSFWFSLQAIARMENMTLEAFVEAVESSGPSFDLSSNLRVAILEYFQAQLADNIAMAKNAEPIVKPAKSVQPTFWQWLMGRRERTFQS